MCPLSMVMLDKVQRRLSSKGHHQCENLLKDQRDDFWKEKKEIIDWI